MTLFERLLFLISLFAIFFGLMIILGVSIGNPESKPNPVGDMLGVIFFGLVPVIGGSIAGYWLWKKGKGRQQERKERFLLNLAKKNKWTRYMTVREAFGRSVNTVFGRRSDCILL